MRHWTAVLVLLGLTGAARPAEPDVRAAVGRGLKFLTADSVAWKEKYNCTSCHHAGLTIWALREAKVRGHAVDEAVLTEYTRWIADAGDGAKRVTKRTPAAPNALNVYAPFMALALGADPQPEAKVRAALAGIRKTVRSEQTADGSWQAWPDTRPPIFGPSNVAMTALATLALTPPTAAADDADLKAVREKALKWLDAARPDDEFQGTAFHLVLARRLGRPAAATEPLVQRVLTRQNPNGGWSQTRGMASDALATGQALYALAEAGRKPDDAAVRRGQAFLVKTQRPDGSWAMTSRPCPPTNKGGKNLVPITGAGSAWGVLGLVRSLKQQEGPPAPVEKPTGKR